MKSLGNGWTDMNFQTMHVWYFKKLASNSFFINHRWQIKDFPNCPLLFGFFSKNCIEMNNIGPRGPSVNAVEPVNRQKQYERKNLHFCSREWIFSSRQET